MKPEKSDVASQFPRIHYDVLLARTAIRSSIRASCLVLFFSLINVDPTDVGDRDCRMLKKDYPSYACCYSLLCKNRLIPKPADPLPS